MTRMSEELPDNPFAAIVDHVVETADAMGDTSEENISRLVTTALNEVHEASRPEDLFDERESLRRIRDCARQRMVGPGAVLLGVLQRATTAMPAHVMIPPMIGSPKPINTVFVNVGPSGHGKTASDDAAEEYWPADLPVFPLGTAEGMCQAFDPDEDGQPRVPNIIFTSSEIDNWAALGERAGSMTFPVMRQVVTGDTIGQKNASKGHTRVVAKRSYRAGINLSAQPGSNGAAVLFRDAPGGFPQRCVFGSVLDPDAPDEPLTGIEPYRPDTEPDFTPNSGPYYEIPFPESVAAEIRAHQRGVLRGVPGINPLDGHRNLSKAKVAVGLMRLEGRNRVTEDDWRIAERIMEVSDRVRADLIRVTEQAARNANRAKALAVADREEVVSDHKLKRAKQAIIRWLAKSGELAARDLRPKLKADIRPDFEAAIAELAEDGHIHVIEVTNGKRYRIAGEVHAVPRVQPLKGQFNDAVPEVQHVPPDNVTELDFRRPHDDPRPKLSCQKWFDSRIADLVAEGHTPHPRLLCTPKGRPPGTADSSFAPPPAATPTSV